MPSKITFSNILVFSQLSSAGLLLLTGPLLADYWIGLIVQLIGLSVGVWAIVLMKMSNKFNVPPEVRKGSKLVKQSIYKYIRHPMYTSVLLYFLPALIFYFSWWRMGYFGILLVTLILKINYEEKLLKAAFSDYVNYQKHSWHLIPFVY